MNKTSILIGAFSFLLVYGCAHKYEVKEITSFNKNGQLTAQVKKIAEPILLPRYMGITGEKLMVYKEKEHYMFEFFSLPEAEYLGSAGTRGQGPNEWIGILDPRSFCLSDTAFSVIDASVGLLKTAVYRGDSTLAIVRDEPVREGRMPYQGFYPLRDSMYAVAGNIMEPQELCLFDGRSNEVVKSTDFPHWVDLDGSGNQLAPAFAYIKNCVVNAEGTRLASFYGYFKRMRIYDGQLNLLHDVDIRIAPCHTNFSLTGNMAQQPVYYIGQPQAVGGYIYALCSNAAGSGHDVEKHPELHVFDWEGNAVACYGLDRDVSLIAISGKHRKMYALNMNVEDELYIYDLPEL